MVQSNKKDDYLSRMEDSLQQQINLISAETQKAKDNPQDCSQLHSCLQKIEEISDRLELMVPDIFDIISIKNGMYTIASDEFSLYSLLETIRDTVIRDATKKNIKFDLFFHDLHHDELVGDVSKLMQIMVNLLSNALKFTPKDGLIQVSVEETLAPNPDSSHFRITIRDSGIGMSEEQLSTLFDPFPLMSTPPKTQNGLGLIVTKCLVDLLGGTIDATSQPGVGSVFTVELDLQTQAFFPYSLPDRATQPTIAFQGLRFLVADDSELSLTISCTLLEDAGATTQRVHDGKQALDLFLTNPPGYYQFILMDIHMPVMNGLEAASAIRASHKSDAATIPIIAMTTNPFANGINHSLESGINAHLAKPLNSFDVLMTISKFL